MKIKKNKITLKKNKMTLMGWLLLAGFCIYAIILLVPLIWGIYTSFKTPHNFTEDPIGFPSPWSFQNFSTVMKSNLSLFLLWIIVLMSLVLFA